MGQGELDQISLAIGNLEGRFEAGITTLTDAVKDLGEKFTGVITTVHLHGERLGNVEITTKMLHDHHTGRAAIVRLLKAIPVPTIWTIYAAIGGSGLGAVVASQWKAIIGLLH